MAFERTPPLLGVGNRAPHNDAVGAALLNINDEHGAILSGPLRACLDRRGLKVGIAWTQWPADIRGQFCRGQRRLHGAATKCRNRERYQR